MQPKESSMATTVWNIDAAHTSVEFAVKHMMLTTVRGHFKEVSGTITVDDDNPERSKVEVEIGAASLDTGVGDRDTHLKSADFLDAEKYPKITFRSTGITGSPKKEGDKFKITGDLSIRGKTIAVTLDATYEGQGKDPWGNQKAGASATTEIDRREWGLIWNQALEAGGVLVANKVRINLEMQAVKPQAPAA
jgi:polyisoprenoid-binding protein YceI